MTIGSKISMFFLLSLLLPVFAFSPEGEIQAPRKMKYISYLACDEIETTYLPKRVFDSLIAMPLCSKDSSHMPYTVQGFEITYAERGLYQDSTGLPIIFTDYTNIPVEGNTLSKTWVDQFKERSYKGDTIYIDKVRVLGADSKSYESKGLKIIIK